jgi:sugar O-acyltransferase (sialic acid O-acetyltransferase NeuD family)
VHGRNEIPWEQRIEYDIEYVERYSLWLDCKILLRTLVLLVRRDGVYAAGGGANDAFGTQTDTAPASAETHAGTDVTAAETEQRAGVTAGAAAPAATPAPQAVAAIVTAAAISVAAPAVAPSAAAATPPAAMPAVATAVATTPTAATPAAPTSIAATPTAVTSPAATSALLPLIIIGAGGHSRVLVDLAEKQGRYRVVGLLDDRQGMRGTTILGYPVLGGREILERDDAPAHAIVAIGAAGARAAWQEHLEARGLQLAVLVHPSAQVGRDVRLGAGTVLMAGAIVNSGSRLGRGVIVNTGASIDHDCEIGDFVHVAPGARLAGGVRVGDRAHIGIGACVIQNLRVGHDAVVGAGAAVVREVAPATTVAGVPARPLPARATAAEPAHA